jgi:hypothetical protein
MSRLSFIMFLGAVALAAWGRDAGLFQTKISHLTCPVQDTDTRGGRIPLPCWAADVKTRERRVLT